MSISEQEVCSNKLSREITNLHIFIDLTQQSIKLKLFRGQDAAGVTEHKDAKLTSPHFICNC